jgi:hypothetical protein
MPDLNNLSDEELNARIGAKLGTTSYSHLSDEELNNKINAKLSGKSLDQERMPGWEGAVAGIANGITLQHGPQLAAGAHAVYDKLSGTPEEFKKLYNQYLVEEQNRVDRAKKDQPYAYGLGEVGGQTGLTALTGAPSIGKAALFGGVIGSGDSQADPSKDPKQYIQDIAKGAATAGTIQGATGVASNLFGKLGSLGIQDLSSKGLDAIHQLAAENSGFVTRIGINKLYDVIKNSPQLLGKFGNFLSQAASNSPLALVGAHVMLSNDPEYDKILQNSSGQEVGTPATAEQGLRLPRR